jgi:hypothetical protein
MSINMLISSKDADSDELHELTYDLMNMINRETELRADLPEVKNEPGARGDAVSIGQIVLTALTSGTVVALMEVIKVYFERKPSLKIALQRSDGEEMTVEAEHLSSTHLSKTLDLTERFLNGKSN